MHIDLGQIALELLNAQRIAQSIEQGKTTRLPVVQITEGEVHILVAVTVKRDARHTPPKTTGPSSTGKLPDTGSKG